MIYEEMSGKIIGAAMAIRNELKTGLDEKLYERALIIELERQGHAISVQRSFPVSHRGELIGNLIPDLIVDRAVIVDPKVVSCFTETHVAQMIGYFEHHTFGFNYPAQFQKRSTRMETRLALARI
jgi:GxxExxY protein